MMTMCHDDAARASRSIARIRIGCTIPPSSLNDNGGRGWSVGVGASVFLSMMYHLDTLLYSLFWSIVGVRPAILYV